MLCIKFDWELIHTVGNQLWGFDYCSFVYFIQLDIDRRGSKISFQRILSTKISTKIPNSICRWGRGWWLTFDAESRNAKIKNFHFQGGGGGGWQLTFDAESRNAKILNSDFVGRGVGSQLLMLSPEMLKSKILISRGGGGLVANFQKSTSNLKVKSWAEISIFGVGGGGCWPTFRSQLQNLKVKSWAEISISAGGEGWERGIWNAWNLVLPPSVHLGWTNRFRYKILQHILSECITDSSLRKLISICSIRFCLCCKDVFASRVTQVIICRASS